MKTPPKVCQICGSVSWQRINTYHTGFSVGKCIIGRVLFGHGGKWLGFAGKKRKVYACKDCRFVTEYE